MSWWPAGSRRWFRASDLPLPSALDVRTSYLAMLQFTGLAGVFGCACLVGQSIRWRKRLLAVMVLVTTSVALEGLLERTSILKFYESQHVIKEGYGFASFNYHANAGAFLNLGFALACGGAGTSRGRSRRLVLLLFAAVICLAGIAATGSRGSGVIAAFSVAATVVFAVKRRWSRVSANRSIPRTSSRRMRVLKGDRLQIVSAMIAGALTIAVLTMVVSQFGGRAVARWSSLPVTFSETNARLLFWKLALPQIIHAGPFGFGPGNLKILLSLTREHYSPVFGHWIFVVYDPARPTSMWMRMHNDPLQTIVEWGWIGAVLWTILVGGAFANSGTLNRQRFPILLAVAGCLFHAYFDFPLQVPVIQVYVAALLGLGLARRRLRFAKSAVTVPAGRQ